jgi:hypothetical protein
MHKMMMARPPRIWRKRPGTKKLCACCANGLRKQADIRWNPGMRQSDVRLKSCFDVYQREVLII